MKTAFKTLFLAALRSDEFTQTKGALEVIKDDGTICNCVLGVAARLAVRQGAKVTITTEQAFTAAETDAHIKGYTCYGGSTHTLPAELRDYIGLDSGTGLLPTRVMFPDEEGITCYTLANLNDVGASFRQIADVIEAQF